ncbi:MAG TPA: (d)CMP kinase [Bacteroidota bacterium]|nr:(d)CMP kinase [Bacteroidota bacterium]
MSTRKLVIAIDGPAASGKSTTAKLVAERLGYIHLDTGAMYRAITLKVLRAGISPGDADAIGRLARSTHVELRRTGGATHVLLDGEDVSAEIRTPEVTRAVSAVSSQRAVRSVMVREQRQMGEHGGIVLEGRDIGTVVFPDADVKFFLIAGIESRARRRARELRESGREADVALLKQEIRERDAQDSTREESPLKRAADAIELDTSELTIEEQVRIVLDTARRKLEEAGKG